MVKCEISPLHMKVVFRDNCYCYSEGYFFSKVFPQQQIIRMH